MTHSARSKAYITGRHLALVGALTASATPVLANITDVKKIINLAGYTVEDSTPLYWTQPGRSAFASIAIKL